MNNESFNNEPINKVEEREVTNKTPDILWPEFFIEELAESRAKIEEKFSENNLNAGLLLAELFKYKVISEANLESTTALEDSLAKIGSVAYAFWKEIGLDPEEACSQAEIWAENFSAQLKKHNLGISVVSPGFRKDSSFMSYRPDPNNLIVNEVMSWVLKKGEAVIRKANIV